MAVELFLVLLGGHGLLNTSESCLNTVQGPPGLKTEPLGNQSGLVTCSSGEAGDTLWLNWEELLWLSTELLDSSRKSFIDLMLSEKWVIVQTLTGI